jgi:hypothetical protein
MGRPYADMQEPLPGAQKELKDKLNELMNLPYEGEDEMPQKKTSSKPKKAGTKSALFDYNARLSIKANQAQGELKYIASVTYEGEELDRVVADDREAAEIWCLESLEDLNVSADDIDRIGTILTADASLKEAKRLRLNTTLSFFLS